MKDMGEVAYILSVKFSKDPLKKLMSLLQKLYINKILKRFQIQYCKPINIPIAKGKGLSWRICLKTLQEEEYMRKVPYTSAVESLIYAMMCKRPNIYFTVSMVSQY